MEEGDDSIDDKNNNINNNNIYISDNNNNSNINDDYGEEYVSEHSKIKSEKNNLNDILDNNLVNDNADVDILGTISPKIKPHTIIREKRKKKD